jgi:hypothetical protein
VRKNACNGLLCTSEHNEFLATGSGVFWSQKHPVRQNTLPTERLCDIVARIAEAEMKYNGNLSKNAVIYFTFYLLVRRFLRFPHPREDYYTCFV